MKLEELREKLLLDKHNLSGQTALVTGAARGIGEQTALLLSSLGANIIIADILPKGNEVAKAITQNGGKAIFIQCDLSNIDEVKQMTEEITRNYGHIDILVNNAMKLLVKPLLFTSYEEWQEVYDTNLKPAFFTIKQFLPGMIERKRGTIVNLIAYEGSPLTSAYSATKVGLRSLAYTTARELGTDSGVSVFSFIPGIVDTPGLRESLLPGLSQFTGHSAEVLTTTILAQNPGYASLMPAEDSAAALVYTIMNGAEYHGQVADPFEPLQRFGIIDLPSAQESISVAAGVDSALPQHLKQYLSNVNHTNRELEQRILIRTNELNEANKELSRQKLLIEEHRKEIIDSITYARRIQEAILPPLAAIERKFPQSFVLYKPKDIVAGDFYWMEESGDTIFLAACDCTGHGVPGAMVSIVCSAALSRSVKEFGLTDPGKILDKTTELVLQTFEKSSEDVKDGMDISLLAVNRKNNSMHWSGANNPLWYSDKSGMNEIVADKQPVGKSDLRKPFTTHTVPATPGVMLYLFTDGYADQFGGPRGKKFKYKQLEQLLVDTSALTPESQKEKLLDVFNNWKKDLEQVDDVCVVGIKL